MRVTHLVVAVKLMCQLLADTQVSLLAGLLGQTLQLIDIAVSVVLEGKPAVGVEFPQSPGLVDASDKKCFISVRDSYQVTVSHLKTLWTREWPNLKAAAAKLLTIPDSTLSLYSHSSCWRPSSLLRSDPMIIGSHSVKVMC